MSEPWAGDDDWDWTRDETEMDDEEEMLALELAIQDCGQNEDLTRCAHAGTEYCGFRCPFRDSLKR